MKKTRRFLSLKYKIIIATLIPVVTCLVIIGSVVFVSLFNSFRETARSEFLQVSQKYAHSFESKIDNAMNYLSIFASEFEMQVKNDPVDRATLQKTVFEIFEDYKLIDGSSVYFEPNEYDNLDDEYRGTAYGTEASGRICWYFYMDGDRTAYLPEGLENDIEFSLPHYTEAKRLNRPIYTDPVTHEVDGKQIPMFTLTYPINNDSGEFIGAVTVDLFLDDIFILLQNEKIYDTGYIIITNDNERIIYSPNYNDIGGTRAEAGIEYPIPDGDSSSAFFNSTSIINGKDTFAIINKVTIKKLDSDFYILAYAPLDEINTESVRVVALLIFFGFSIVVAIAFLLYFIIGKISAPLNEITLSVDKIAGGNYNARIKGTYKGEFAVVKDSVNTMADSIESYVRDMKMATAALDRRLEQQAVMAAISQSFLSDADIDRFIANALRMTGEFMDVSQILFYKFEDDGVSFVCQSEWLRPGADAQTNLGNRQVLPTALIDIIKSMPARREYWLNSNDPALKPLMKPYMVNYQNYISVPIFMRGSLYGALDFFREKVDMEWSDSDVNLATHVASLMSGIFERHLMEEQLRRLSSIVESCPQYIVCVAADGKMSYANPALMSITGLSETQIRTIGLESIFDAETVREIREVHIPKTLQDGTDNFELNVTGAQGKIRNFVFSSFTIGATDNIGCIVTDMTEFRALESELITAKELAEQASRAKSEFLSRMSHEIRTPLNAIIGMNNLAMNTADLEKTRDYHQKIDNASKHLLGIINDILDMSKIEADNFKLSIDEFDFETVLVNVANVINYRVEEKRQNLVVNLDPDIPPYIFSDELRLSQVIANLLSNAVKFTPENGTIVINARKTGESGEDVTLEIEVRDNGIGISEEQQKRLFSSFEQADGSISRKFGGTGLGLAISKRIVELLGGEIWIESELGRGSRFIFTIKAKKDGTKPDQALPSKAFKGAVRVIAVDPSAETRASFLRMMEAHALHCDAAENGAEALYKLQSFGDDLHNVFFITWQGPDSGVIDLIKRIKEIKSGDSVVLIIPSAEWGGIESVAVDAGATCFISKPLFPSALIDAVNKCLGVESDETEPSESADTSGGSFLGHTILIAEDIEINQEIMSAVLEDTGISIDFADNGHAAVDIFRANPLKYSLIFMDIHMPEMDGYEATRRIRGLPAEYAKKIPIIAMTANVFREDIENCLNAGMNDHIGKPVDPVILFAKLDEYLNHR